MELNEANKALIHASAGRAFAGIVVKALAGVCYRAKQGGITLTAYFVKPLEEDDKETVSIAFTEMLADLHSYYPNWEEQFIGVDAETLPETDAEWLYRP